MQHRSKRPYSYTAVAVIIILAAIVTMAVYSTTTSSRTSKCNGSSTSVYPAYKQNFSMWVAGTARYLGVSLPSGCTVELFLQFDSQNSATNASADTFIGSWYHFKAGGTYTGIHRIQNDTLNATVYQRVAVTNSSMDDFSADFSVTLSASNSTRGIYMLLLPEGTILPLAVGYSVSQINMTKDYPGLEESIPPFGFPPGVGGVSIMRMSTAMSIGYVE